jgi:hypothetical protein
VGCTAADLAQQFGPPLKTVTVTPGVTVFVYDHDITSEFPARVTTLSP